ncbi:MAG TPA: DUF4350 domain-containing protein [Longimicrobiaceae bacterium]|nr:DUF4350 domain-containing protein [Longimicrobiaceae bacterium]
MTSRDRWLLAALVVLVVAISTLAGAKERDQARDARPSSFISSADGTRALFLTLAKLGIPTGRRLTPYLDADSLAGPLVLLAPTQPPTPAEVHALAQWVRRGGTLIYAARMRDPTLDTLGLRLKLLVPDSARFAELMRWRGVAARPRPNPLTEGLAAVPGFRFGFLPSSPRLADSAATPLLVTGDGQVTALAARLGAGRVVAISDPAPLTNGAVRRSGMAPLFVRAAAAGSGRVIFDEYHQGFRRGGGAAVATIHFLRRTGPGHALLQLAVVALGLLLVAGRRFGSPLPPPPARRRDPLEHVDALGEAYRRAGARRTARRLLLGGVLRRLGRRPAAGDADDFEALHVGLPASVRESFAALEAEYGKDDGADLVALTGHMDRILTQIRTRR